MSEETERHATNLELFLDLVFVFAVTQIASLVSHDLTLAGAGRGALIAWLVWWQWSQFTWAGSAIDLQQRPATRILVLCTIPATLAMAVAIPNVFHESGVHDVAAHDSAAWFAVAYMIVQLLVLGMQGTTAWRDAATRQSFFNYASLASIAPLVVVAGSFGHGRARLIVWIIAALVDVAGGLRGAAGEWVINPVHFAERHALFVIICLGEALVAIGTTASEIGLTLRILTGLAAATAVACILWWTYFAFIPDVAEHILHEAHGPRRGQVARDLFTFGHFPIVAGIIAYAVVVKHMVAHPSLSLGVSDRWLLVAALAMLVGGYLHIQFRVVHHLSSERFVAIAAVAVWVFAGASLPGSAIVAGVAVILAAMHSVTWRKFRGDELRVVTANR
jgi:low temperature requirement protein LtrA